MKIRRVNTLYIVVNNNIAGDVIQLTVSIETVTLLVNKQC